MTISVQVTGTEQLRRYQQLLDRLSNPNHKPQLLDALGAVVESQTRRRIADEKESPDGQAWPDWSQAYA
ncbi:phage virion morphogenesis protein, partial [Photobacterium damselae]